MSQATVMGSSGVGPRSQRGLAGGVSGRLIERALALTIAALTISAGRGLEHRLGCDAQAPRNEEIRTLIPFTLSRCRLLDC